MRGEGVRWRGLCIRHAEIYRVGSAHVLTETLHVTNIVHLASEYWSELTTFRCFVRNGVENEQIPEMTPARGGFPSRCSSWRSISGGFGVLSFARPESALRLALSQLFARASATYRFLLLFLGVGLFSTPLVLISARKSFALNG